jgi:hypothetical protein
LSSEPRPAGDIFVQPVPSDRQEKPYVTGPGKPLALAENGSHDPTVTKTLADEEQSAAGYFVALRQILSHDGYFPASIRQSSCEYIPMTEPHRPRVKYVIGPDGSPLTIADLPPPSTKRWVIRRKAEVVAAVRGGLLSLEEACARYTLTVEEFLSWQYSIDQHGLAGLRTTRIQQYRQ